MADKKKPIPAPGRELPEPHDMELEPGYGNELSSGKIKKANRSLPKWLLSLIALLIVFLTGGIYLLNMQKSNQKIVPPTQPTPTLADIIPSPTLYPSVSPEKCDEADKSFCGYFQKLLGYINSKDFDALVAEQIREPFTCPKTEEGNPTYYVCEGQPAGKIIYGYHKGRNESEGGVFPKSYIIDAYKSHFSEKSPLQYHGFKEIGNKGILVYLTEDQGEMLSFRLEKTSGRWHIAGIIEGSSYGYKSFNNDVFTNGQWKDE